MIVKVYKLEETGSTNDYAAKMAESGDPHGTLVRAERQNAGKGRRGREWDSPYGVNLYFSLLLRPAFAPEKAPMLTLLMAAAVARAIKELYGCSAAIKWPNDIVLNRKKVCGILTEMKLDKDKIDHVVIGTGINVNMVDFPAPMQESATSLLLECRRKVSERISQERFNGILPETVKVISGELSGEASREICEKVSGEISREELLNQVLQNFSNLYKLFETENNLAFVQEEYNRHLAGLGEEVRVLDPKGEFTGISRGITAGGELLVERQINAAETEMVEVYAGEVSVRGMNGYV